MGTGERDPFGLLGSEIETRDTGGLLAYFLTAVVVVAGVVALAAVLLLWPPAGIDLPDVADTLLFLLVAGGVTFGGLYAVLRVNDWRRGI